jgi:hypothetical protein
MSGHLIVITGSHGCIREVLQTFILERDDASYLACLEESLQADSPESQLDRALMEGEFKRDAIDVLPVLDAGRTVTIEQWHFGNLARMKLRAPRVAQVYEERLVEHLSGLKGVDLRVFYVSTNVKKMITDASADAKRDELRELASVIKRFELPLDTIDGEAPPRYIEKRLLYLLTHILPSADTSS